MNNYQIIFSPTGGTEKVANAITQTWSQVNTIDLSVPDINYKDISFESDSLVLIAMPSFGGVAPQLALDRLSMLNGNGALCVITAVAGHSIIHDYAAGRPNLDDCKVLAKFGEQVLEKVSSNDFSKPSVPGNRPYKKAGAGMIPKAGSACTSCGQCALKCPASAISTENLNVSNKSKCISCMRCVSICPVHARKVSSLMTSIAATAIKKACSVEKANELFV